MCPLDPRTSRRANLTSSGPLTARQAGPRVTGLQAALSSPSRRRTYFCVPVRAVLMERSSEAEMLCQKAPELKMWISVAFWSTFSSPLGTSGANPLGPTEAYGGQSGSGTAASQALLEDCGFQRHTCASMPSSTPPYSPSPPPSPPPVPLLAHPSLPPSVHPPGQKGF